MPAGRSEEHTSELQSPLIISYAVFVRMPEPLLKGLLARGWYFYTFIGTGEARLMCSWQTTEEDIAELVSDLRSLAGNP